MNAQIYKIYINGTPLQLIDQVMGIPEATEVHLVARYAGIPKMLFNYVDLLEKKPKFRVVTLYSDDVEQLFQDFRGHFTLIEAAGGLVYRPDGQILTMFRRGIWDLPKGKIDPGESPEQAALREVIEETGLQHATLLDDLLITYHTYRQDGQRVLKKTWWYLMQAEDQPLTPETAEGIERVNWMDARKFLAEAQPVYGNIRDVVQAGLSRLPEV